MYILKIQFSDVQIVVHRAGYLNSPTLGGFPLVFTERSNVRVQAGICFAWNVLNALDPEP